MYENQTMYQVIKQNAIESPNVRAVFYKGTSINYKKFN